MRFGSLLAAAAVGADGALLAGGAVQLSEGCVAVVVVLMVVPTDVPGRCTCAALLYVRHRRRVAMTVEGHSIYAWLAGALATETEQEESEKKAAVMGGAGFQRLLLEVFNKDMDAFKEYCMDVEEWADAVDFLGDVDGGGWDLLDMLLQGSSTCENLLESPFLSDW